MTSRTPQWGDLLPMSAHPTHPLPPGKLGIALLAAWAYKETALNSTAHLDWTTKETAVAATSNPVNLGHLIVTATSFCFALETYLKAVRIRFLLPRKRGHGLHELWGQLPTPHRSAIESAYADRRGSLVPPRPVRLTWIEWNGPSERPPTPHPEHPVGHTLSDLLRAHDRAYTTWRYIYENAPQNSFISAFVARDELDLACTVLEEYCTKGLSFAYHSTDPAFTAP